MTTVPTSILPLVKSFKEGHACLLCNQLENLLEKQLLSNEPLSSEERRTLGEFNFAFEWIEKTIEGGVEYNSIGKYIEHIRNII